MRALAASCLLFLTSIAAAPADARDPRHLVVVSGIGGESFYRDLFHRWALSFLDHAGEHLQFDPAQLVYLAEDPGRAPERISGRSDKVEIERTLRSVAERSEPGDLVMLLLIGHGTARGDRVLFNLPGPDLSAAELSTLLDGLDDRRVVVVNAASSSGPFIPVTSGPSRVVITATANAAENRHPRFGGHFVNAFTAPAADRDKDDRVSLLEAFVFADRQVAMGYERDKRMRTEHALLDDDGDGTGTSTPGGGNSDGRLAARIFLKTESAPDSSNPGARALSAASFDLLNRIESLKRRKREFASADYTTQLESLLVELALVRRALRGGP